MEIDIRNILSSLISKNVAICWPPLGIQEYVNKAVIRRSLKMRVPESFRFVKVRILAICCYMADRPNLIQDLVHSVGEAKVTEIDFVVTNNTRTAPCTAAKPYVKYTLPGMQKYLAVARIIKDQLKPHHDYVLVIDDDVRLPPNFFDKYFMIAHGLRLIVSQPAMTDDSYKTFLCNQEVAGAIAHLTPFVEVGPVTCFERRIVRLVPFEEGSPMGWGLDYIWSRICRDRRWPMGVVDYTPVQHNLRGVATGYDKKREILLMKSYLSNVRHVPIYSTQVIGQIIFEKDYPALQNK